MTINKRTAQELKEHFLEKASPLLDQYLDATFGLAPLKSTDATCRKEVWGLLKTFLEKADEKIILEEKYRTGPEGVLLAIQDGVLTLEEGERLIEIHCKINGMNKVNADDQTDTSFIPSLIINTLPAPAKQIENKEVNYGEKN